MEVAQAIESERMLFRACVYLGISQKKNWSVEASCIFEVFHSVKVNYQIIKIRHFLRLRITQKALQLPLFSSFCYSLQQIWMDWQNLLVQFSRSVKLGECGLIRTHWKTCENWENWERVTITYLIFTRNISRPIRKPFNKLTKQLWLRITRYKMTFAVSCAVSIVNIQPWSIYSYLQ